MNKHILSLSFVSAAIITIFIPYQQVFAQANFLTYTNSQFGYSIQYPSDWSVNKNLTNAITITPSDRSALVLITTNESVNPNMTLQSVGKKILQINSNSVYSKNFSLIGLDPNNFYLAGNPAVRVEFTDNIFDPIMGAVHERFLTLASVTNGRIYDITFATEIAKFSDLSPIFEHMISSFRIPSG